MRRGTKTSQREPRERANGTHEFARACQVHANFVCGLLWTLLLWALLLSAPRWHSLLSVGQVRKETFKGSSRGSARAAAEKATMPRTVLRCRSPSSGVVEATTCVTTDATTSPAPPCGSPPTHPRRRSRQDAFLSRSHVWNWDGVNPGTHVLCVQRTETPRNTNEDT